jgi:glutamate synthase (NADPH/NADH) large chain
MMRKCHSNTCPVGVATQREDLRAKYTGQVEHVVTFFEYLVEGLREIMAELGFRSINEMVGQADCLKLRDDINHWKYKGLDLSPITFRETEGEKEGLYCFKEQNHLMDKILDWKLLEKAKQALENGEKIEASFNIFNTNRSVGTLLSNEISKRYNEHGLPEGTIKFKFRGSAGQSFGAFNARGIELELEGDANDYFGKGLSGGHLIVYPDSKSQFIAEENVIIGNVSFYGATSGKAFIRGIAGERFCVRNSGAEVVVEGIGDHGCEYMTGGKAVILGKTGRNFGAGMSGGVAYILDESNDFSDMCNMDMIEFEDLEDREEIDMLRTLIEEHLAKTDSVVAKRILDNWEKWAGQFVKVMPTDYKKMLGYIEKVRSTGKYRDERNIMDAAFDMHIKNLLIETQARDIEMNTAQVTQSQ